MEISRLKQRKKPNKYRAIVLVILLVLIIYLLLNVDRIINTLFAQ